MAWNEQYHWLSKPPLGTLPDLAHPLCPTVMACLLNDNPGLLGTVWDPISRQKGALTVSAVACTTGRRFNTGLSLTTISDLVNWAANNTFVPTAEITVAVANRKRDATNRASAVFGLNGGGAGTHCEALAPYSDGVVYWDFGGTTTGTSRLSKSGLTFGDDVWVFTAGGRGMEIWQNSLLVASQSGHATRAADAAVFTFGKGQSVFADLADIGFFFMWKNQLSKDQISAFFADLFSFYPPPNHLRWRAPTATVTPVLMSPSQVSYFLPLAEVYQPQKNLPTFSGTTCGIVQTQGIARSSTLSGSLAGPAFASPVATGNMIIVMVAVHSPAITVSSVTDSQSNTYVADIANQDATNDVEVWRASNVTGGAAFTVTVHLTGSNTLTFGAFEAQGYGSAPKDKTNFNTGTSTTPTTGTTGTLAQADELVVAVMVPVNSASQTITTPTGFTSQVKESGTTFQEMDGATQIVAATTALNPQWTLANSAGWTSVIATYKCAGASPAASSALASPSQRFDPLIVSEIRTPLIETRKDPFLPVKPPMRNPSQLFDPLPPVEIRWPLIETRKDPFLPAKPPMAVPSQRWDPPVYVLVQQPGQPFATPVVIPPSPKLKAPDQRWDLPLYPCVVQPSLVFAVPGVTVPVVALQTVNGVFLIRLKGLPPNTLAYLRRNAPDRDICAYHPGYTVPSVDTALPLGASANVALAYLNNLDTINDVVVKDKVGGTVLATIKPLRSMFVRLDALNLIGTPLAVSGVGSPVLEYCLWAPA